MEGRSPIQRILASNLVWRLSGLTYSSAVFATRGIHESPEKYIEDSQRQMASLASYFTRSSMVLEFGCGLGGNLIASHEGFSHGIGIDVNAGYVRIARRLAERFGVTNARFYAFKEGHFPCFSRQFDFVFSLGVFERLPPARVRDYANRLSSLTQNSGSLALYFLSERARGTAFTARLGQEAYTFWTESSVRAATSKILERFSRTKVFPLGYGDIYLFSAQDAHCGSV